MENEMDTGILHINLCIDFSVLISGLKLRNQGILMSPPATLHPVCM